jgi:general secretion pathway protein N
MKRVIAISLLSLVAFAAIVLARLPASWVMPAARPYLACSNVEGSIWRGYCGGLALEGTPLGDATWELHPAALLTGQLAAHVDVLRRNASLHADVRIGWSGTVRARNVRAQIPLDPTLLPMLPLGLTGRARVELAAARFTTRGVIERLQGRIEALDLIQRMGQAVPVGSYEAVFPGGPGAPTARVKDLGGPLAVSGTLSVTAQGYQLEGYVAARQSAAPALVNALEYLGSPDAEGRRSFGVSGTF